MGIAFLGLILIIASVLIGLAKNSMPPGTNNGGLVWGLRILGLAMVVLGPISSAVVAVPAGYRAILLRFGAVQGTLGEGIHFVMPGMNSAVMMEARTQKEESQATAASRDLQTVTTSLALNFRIDPERVGDLYQKVGTEYVSRIIDPAVQESIKVVTAKYTAEELIKNRAQVKQQVEEEITKRLRAYNVIVEPSGLSITNFQFSDEFNKAIEAKQVAQQEAEKQKYVLQQAKLQQQTAIAKAQGTAEAAKLNALSLKVQGGGLVIAREWIEKWDGHLPQVSGGQGNYIIDLKSLMTEAPAKP